MSVITVTNDNFDTEVLNSQQPVLVDFFATWCGPCKMVSPIVDKIAEEETDKKVCKIDVDQAPELAQRFSVASVPTLMVFKDGKVFNSSVGAMNKQQILAMFE